MLPLIIGTAAGALAGGTADFINQGNEQRRAKNIAGVYDTIGQELAGAYGLGNIEGIDTPELQSFREALANFDPSAYYFADPVGFEYKETVQDFLDPSTEYQIEQMQKAQQDNLANMGSLFSGGAMKSLNNIAQQESMKDYGNAFARMQTDRQQKYGEFMDFANALNQGIQQKYNIDTQHTQNLGNIGTADRTYQTQIAQNNAQNAKDSEIARLQLEMEKANLDTSGKTNWGSVFGNALGAAGSGAAIGSAFKGK